MRDFIGTMPTPFISTSLCAPGRRYRSAAARIALLTASVAFASAFPLLFNPQSASARTSTEGSAAKESDSLFSAMSDEIERSISHLKMDQHSLPYFVSYEIKDVNELTMSSILGSKPAPWKEKFRLLTPRVRIGNYDFDSSFPRTSFSHFVTRIPIDDDYAVVRRALWQSTDNAYKNAIRTFEWKKAYLVSNNMPDRLADMTIEKPYEMIKKPSELPPLEPEWSGKIAQLSALFKKYPDLQKSKVTFVGRVVNRRFLNSEGTKIQDSRSVYAIRLWAECQAADGMKLNDYDVIATTNLEKFPPIDELEKRVDDFAEHLVALKNSPLADEYCGPVLFEGQGGAEFFATVFAPNLGLAEEYVGSDHFRNPFKNSIGRKVLPKFVDVIDDPSSTDSSGTPLIGSYQFDDEGVPAGKVVLVEHGILKGFCQSRIPLKSSATSNGHSLDGHGVFRSLMINSSRKSTPEQLRTQLSELAKDTGLDYVLVVSKLGDDYQFVEFPSQDGPTKRPYVTPSYSTQLSDPVYVYKMYLADGRRELVRGLEFRNVSLRAFRDIQATGDDARAYIVEPNDHEDRSVITPSFVVGELEFTQMSPTHTTLPILKSPLELEATVSKSSPQAK